MERSIRPEHPAPEPPPEGISRGKAHLLAEASHWLATGQIVHDRREPMGRVLTRLGEVVPTSRHLEWLMAPNDDLAGHRPMDYIDADELVPLEELMAQMHPTPDAPNGLRPLLLREDSNTRHQG